MPSPTHPAGSDAGPSTATVSTISHLTFPTIDSEPPSIPQASKSQPRLLLKERLYVGNLHQSVDEYTLLQVFAKHGKVAKLDFLFHKTGPLRGKPRGYAFVEFADRNDAERALLATHDKLLRGRKLVVTHAQQAPLDALPPGSRPRRPHEATKPTALSLLKGVGTGKSDVTESKIAKMEAKLRQMEASSAIPDLPSAPTAPLHPSLPARPPPSVTAAAASQPLRRSAPRPKSNSPLPMLPMPSSAPARVATSASPVLHVAPSSVARPAQAERKKLAGVKIVKKKPAI